MVMRSRLMGSLVSGSVFMLCACFMAFMPILMMMSPTNDSITPENRGHGITLEVRERTKGTKGPAQGQPSHNNRLAMRSRYDKGMRVAQYRSMPCR